VTTKKKELAQKLYVSSYFATQKELAEYLETSEQTISKWVKAGKWEELKESYLATVNEEIINVKRQLRALRENMEAEGRPHYNNSEIDIYSKLTASLRSLKTRIGLEDVIDVSIEVLDWLRTHDVKKAQEASAIFNAYIKAHS